MIFFDNIVLQVVECTESVSCVLLHNFTRPLHASLKVLVVFIPCKLQALLSFFSRTFNLLIIVSNFSEIMVIKALHYQIGPVNIMWMWANF